MPSLPPSARGAVKDIDHGWKRIKKMMHEAKNKSSYVKVGVLANSKSKRQSAVARVKIGPNLPKGAKKADNIDNVTLALVHEFGSPRAHIPERSWIRAPFAKNQSRYIAQLGVLMSQIYGGNMTIERALGIMGAIAGDIKTNVRTGGIYPPNTPEVFMRKLMKGTRRFNATGAAPNVLIDTGRMVNSVSWQVVLSRQKGR